MLRSLRVEHKTPNTTALFLHYHLLPVDRDSMPPTPPSNRYAVLEGAELHDVRIEMNIAPEQRALSTDDFPNELDCVQSSSQAPLPVELGSKPPSIARVMLPNLAGNGVVNTKTEMEDIPGKQRAATASQDRLAKPSLARQESVHEVHKIHLWFPHTPST